MPTRNPKFDPVRGKPRPELHFTETLVRASSWPKGRGIRPGDIR